jgi:micrococcal nuclease
MPIPKDVPVHKEMVFDIAKRGEGYRTTATHDEWNKLYKYRAKIEKIYDGDTVTRAVIDLGFHVEFEVPLRLSGIDTPELRGEERPQGIIARDRLRELILGEEVIIETERDKTGKYGRYLATIYYKGKNINQQLLDEGLAGVYG